MAADIFLTDIIAFRERLLADCNGFCERQPTGSNDFRERQPTDRSDFREFNRQIATFSANGASISDRSDRSIQANALGGNIAASPR